MASYCGVKSIDAVVGRVVDADAVDLEGVRVRRAAVHFARSHGPVMFSVLKSSMMPGVTATMFANLPAEGQLGQGFGVNPGRELEGLDVDDRRSGRDRDLLLEGRRLHLQVEGDDLADPDDDLFPFHRLEAGEFRGHDVGSGRERRQPIAAVFLGDVRDRADERRRQRRTDTPGRGSPPASVITPRIIPDWRRIWALKPEAMKPPKKPMTRILRTVLAFIVLPPLVDSRGDFGPKKFVRQKREPGKMFPFGRIRQLEISKDGLHYITTAARVKFFCAG